MAPNPTQTSGDGADDPSMVTSTSTTTSSTKTCQDAEDYSMKVLARVKSFDEAPLHSTAYLGYLAKYLRRPFKQLQQHQSLPQYQPEARKFIDRYVIQPNRMPDVACFNNPDDLRASGVPAGNELLFLRGHPSAAWLTEIGQMYKLDHRFYHSHLAATIPNRQHWYALPTLPSRAAGMLKFRIPTIVQVGAAGRDLSVEQLEYARHKCNEHLRKMFRSIRDCTAEPGHSLIRAINIHNGNILVMEQEMTATVVHRGDLWSVIVWTDTGDERGTAHVPVPTTEGFSTVTNQRSFWPTFFENDLVEGQLYTPHTGTPVNGECRQPMVVLSNQYGSTVNWASPAGATPTSVIQELLTFEACAVLQYFNMLEDLPTELMRRTQFPSYEHTKLETILHFDYTKEVLSRWKTHLLELLAFVSNPPEAWRPSMTPREGSSTQSRPLQSDSTHDITYLLDRAETLVAICDDSKATLMSNASVQEAKRSSYEASLVTGLTKATNRLTFIFLPISFITSVFGMNFSQFGQGPLSIWIWVAITCPILIFSIIIVEKGSWIKTRFRQKRQKPR